MDIAKLTISGANNFKHIYKNISGKEAGKTMIQHQRVERFIAIQKNRQPSAISLRELSRDMLEIRQKQAQEAEKEIC